MLGDVPSLGLNAREAVGGDEENNWGGEFGTELEIELLGLVLSVETDDADVERSG